MTSVTESTLADPLEAGGVVAAAQTATLTSRIVATVMTVRVRAGDRVRAGEPLVVLDDRDTAAQARQAVAAVGAMDRGLDVARSELAAALADQTLAAASHARIVALHGRGSATAQERDEVDARLAGANARVASVRARIEQAVAQLAEAREAAAAASARQGFSVIRAPFNGLVTERFVDPGATASPGTPLVRVDASGPRHVEVQVDEARARFVRPGTPAEVLIHGAAGDAEVATAAEVTEIGRALRADQRAFMVKVSLPADSATPSGTFARVRFKGATRPALVIPASAIRRQGQLATLFVNDNGVARLRLVRTGREGPEGVEVISGLDKGEPIVADPPASLTDGQRISARPGTQPGAKQ